MTLSIRRLSLVWILVLTIAGCQTAQFAVLEKFGIEKRDVLVDRVEDATESQQEAQQQFKSALEQLSELIQFDGGELQRVYESLSDEYEASKSAADDVTKHIDKIEDVAEALFDEWRDELEQYKNQNFKRQSAKQLAATERNYQRLIKAMRKTESKMEPVLSALHDNVLYLKHNLNARAIGALKGELGDIKVNINRLIQDMNRTIAESNQFIEQLKS